MIPALGYRTLARTGGSIILLLLLATLTSRIDRRPRVFESQAPILFESVSLDASAPGRRALGDLVYLGGWSLSSDNPGFGGISAMHVAGGQVTALNDSGLIIRFPVPQGWRGVVHGRIDPLVELPRNPLMKEARDTESLAVGNGAAWVGYERRNIIRRYRTSDWHSDTMAMPRAMRRWPRNGGSEALVRLRDGRFLVFSERARHADGTSDLLLFDGDPVTATSELVSLGYRAPPAYVVTDAAELPDGRLLVLNRRLSWISGISARLEIAELPRSGDVMAGQEIAVLKPPVAVDNMEALSVTREAGRTIVWIASDDNFSPPLQRTLLLKFALVERTRTRD